MKDRVKAILDELKSTTAWLAAVIVTTAIVTSLNAAKLKLLDADVSRAQAGLLLFGLSSVVLVHLFRLLTLLRDVMLSKESIDAEVLQSITWHPWPLNPFMHSPNAGRPFLDSLGIAALVVLWWLGALAGLRLLRGTEVAHNAGSFALFVLYGFLGIAVSYAIGKALPLCVPKGSVTRRGLVAFVAFVVGMWFSFQ